MATIRYTGEDIPVDITLKDDDGTVIDPNTLAGIKVYVIDSDPYTDVLLKAAYPEDAGYNELILQETFVRLWLEKTFTSEMANRKISFEVAIYETEADLTEGIQTTIAVSETLTIKAVRIKAEGEQS